jgi:hypothetical protein
MQVSFAPLLAKPKVALWPEPPPGALRGKVPSFHHEAHEVIEERYDLFILKLRASSG